MNSNRQTSSPEDVVHLLKSDTVAAELQKSKVAPAGENRPGTVDTPAAITAGKIVERITLTQGQTLRLLALDLFGNREFWVYIYLENKKNIQNPNVVPIGTELVIPDPVHYNINATEPQSVESARELGDKILNNIKGK